MLGQLSLQPVPRDYNPETDAPAAGQFVIDSYRDFVLATVALPLVLCLVGHLSKQGSSHRRRHRPAAANGHHQATVHHHQQQQQQRYHQGVAMDTQQHTPQTDRPFRQSHANRQAVTPQSDRPFRVTQSQRVYSTPDSAQQQQQPTSTTQGVHAPASQTIGANSNRPFRVSSAARTPHASHASQGPHSSSPAARLFSFRPLAEIEQPGMPAAAHAASQFQQQQQDRPFRRQQGMHGGGWQGHDVGGSSSQHSNQQRYGLPQDDLAGSEQEQEEDLQEEAEQQHDWDPSLLASCARNARYISSLEGLQQSPEYTQHIRNVRKQQLTYEDKEQQKLRVYKALRRVDPESFKQLFSRKEVLEYDEAPLSWWLAALECILSAGMTFVLLGLPLWHTAFHPCQQGLATLWGLLCFWVVWFKGCTSVAAYALGPIYATQGPYSMQPGSLRLVLAASVEAALAVVAPVFPLGVLASLACRLLTQQRQSCGERLLRLQPMREVVRPMHFSPYTRGAAGSARSSVSDADE